MKQITKETSRKVLREDGVEYMQVEKCTLIYNTSNDPIATATVGITFSRANEDNIRNMTRTINDLQERNKQLEQ